MTSQTAGVFNINGEHTEGGQKCYFFPVDREGNLLEGADDIFGDATESFESFQLPKLATHLRDEKYERVFVLCHGWNNHPEAVCTLFKWGSSYADAAGRPRTDSQAVHTAYFRP